MRQPNHELTPNNLSRCLLASATFPKDASMLIMTDGFCEESLTVSREHAFLVPAKIRLPFYTRNPIFYMD